MSAIWPGNGSLSSTAAPMPAWLDGGEHGGWRGLEGLVVGAPWRSPADLSVFLTSVPGGACSGFHFLNRVWLMAEDAKRKVRAELRNTQASFERVDAQRKKAGAARRESFERAQNWPDPLKSVRPV